MSRTIFNADLKREDIEQTAELLKVEKHPDKTFICSTKLAFDFPRDLLIMVMDKVQLQNRTKSFAIRVFKMVEKLPMSKRVDVITYQLIKASSSVAAN